MPGTQKCPIDTRQMKSGRRAPGGTVGCWPQLESWAEGDVGVNKGEGAGVQDTGSGLGVWGSLC